MTLPRPIAIGALAWALIGCSPKPPLVLGRFVAYGDLDALPPRPRRVERPEQVKLFYGAAPPGLTLRQDQLSVEPGYRHVILGPLRMQWNENLWCRDGQLVTKAEVLQQMRRSAMEQGGTAVVFVLSNLPDEPREPVDLCDKIRANASRLATGWVVVLDSAAATDEQNIISTGR